MKKPKVALVMGSQSDWRVMKVAAQTLQNSNIEFDAQIVSAHRTPEKLFSFAKSAHARGYRVIIAAAGGAAHLPGMIAALTPLPVIGVPINATTLEGVDALVSIAQMPAGVPVATVDIDGAEQAAQIAISLVK